MSIELNVGHHRRLFGDVEDLEGERWEGIEKLQQGNLGDKMVLIAITHHSCGKTKRTCLDVTLTQTITGKFLYYVRNWFTIV